MSALAHFADLSRTFPEVREVLPGADMVSVRWKSFAILLRCPHRPAGAP
jgi:hypothetical protein